MESNHPIIDLLAFIDGDVDEADVDALSQLAERLAQGNHRWMLGAPQFVDEIDEDGIRTVGLLHKLYAAYDASGRLLDESTDRRSLEEVQLLVSELQSISGSAEIEIGLELGGESVGWIEDGEMTESLRVGLLESWAARFV
jgi:hypothetical protein